MLGWVGGSRCLSGLVCEQIGIGMTCGQLENAVRLKGGSEHSFDLKLSTIDRNDMFESLS